MSIALVVNLLICVQARWGPGAQHLWLSALHTEIGPEGPVSSLFCVLALGPGPRAPHEFRDFGSRGVMAPVPYHQLSGPVGIPVGWTTRCCWLDLAHGLEVEHLCSGVPTLPFGFYLAWVNSCSAIWDYNLKLLVEKSVLFIWTMKKSRINFWDVWHLGFQVMEEKACCGG